MEQFLTRHRIAVALAALGVVALGLLTRSALVPRGSLAGQYGGDTLWATLVYLLGRWLWPRTPVARAAAGAAALAAAVELSQLYHAPWIDAVRETTLGHLVLGQGFLWSDMACYAAGVALGACAELGVRRAYRRFFLSLG